MYKVLIDSSNSDLAVGLAKDGTLIAEKSYEAWQKQSEFLVSEIDVLLRENHVENKDISAVVASKGPGSYTGVRIALTVGKVMAFVLKVPLYLVSSLAVLLTPNAISICLMNARSNRSYIGVYQNGEALMKDTIMDNDQVLNYIKEHPDYVVSGDTKYLSIEGKINDIPANLLSFATKSNLCPDVLAAKPVYLKDNYPV